MAATSLDPTIWGATQTTTFTTTTTATVGQVVYLTFPTLAAPPSLQYTTFPSPTSPFSKQYPDGLPILVLTQVDGIIVDPSGQVLTTATVVQSPPTPPSGQKVVLVPGSSTWASWTEGEKGGVIAATVFSVLGLIGVFLYLCHVRRKRKKMERDMERGPRGGGGKKKAGSWVEKMGMGRKEKATEIKKEKKVPRGIEGLEGVEMGPAAMRSVYGDLSTGPPPRSGNGTGIRRNNHSPGRDRFGGRDIRGALQRDDNAQRAPVGQRPLLPPNQLRVSRTDSRHVGADTGAAAPSGGTMRSEARKSERARHRIGEGSVNGIRGSTVSEWHVPLPPKGMMWFYERLIR